MHTDDNSINSKIHFLLTSIFMKKFAINILSLLLITSALISCDKIPDGIVESQNVDYLIIAITAPSSVTYIPTDSTVIASIQLSKVNSVNAVWYKVSTFEGTLIVKNKVMMFDDGNSNLNGDQLKNDGIYSGKFVMSKLNPNGKYQIEFFVEDNVRTSPDNVQKVGTQIFSYNNNQQNFAPVISNLSIPSSVNREVNFVFSLTASDPNSYSDIQSVYYEFYRPNGTLVSNSQGISKFPLFDDGNVANDGSIANDGDLHAGDGIFTNQLLFPTNQPTGVWRFEFHAIDRVGKLSNVIIHNLTLN